MIGSISIVFYFSPKASTFLVLISRSTLIYLPTFFALTMYLYSHNKT